MVNRLMQRLSKKLATNDGETLVETLVSTLILAGVVLMLCTAIVAAAKANTALEVETTVVNVNETDPNGISGPTISVKSNSGDNYTPRVTFYEENGYIYYVPTSSN